MRDLQSEGIFYLQDFFQVSSSLRRFFAIIWVFFIQRILKGIFFNHLPPPPPSSKVKWSASKESHVNTRGNLSQESELARVVGSPSYIQLLKLITMSAMHEKCHPFLTNLTCSSPEFCQDFAIGHSKL